MIDKQKILNSFFFPRKSHLEKDSKDYLINVEKDIFVGTRFFLKNKLFDNIIFFHGNGEISKEYDDIAALYHHFNINIIV